METDTALVCPFCEFTDNDSYIIMLHVETLHSEGDSPFLVKDSESHEPDSEGRLRSNPKDVEEEYVECHVEGCGETLLLSEIVEHLDMHSTETMTLDDAGYETKADEAPSKRYEVPDDIESKFSTHLPGGLRNYDSLSQSAELGHHGTRHRRKDHHKHDTKDQSRFLQGNRSFKLEPGPTKINAGTKGRLGVKGSV